MNAVTVYENNELEFYGVPMSPDGMKAQVDHIQMVMRKVMKKDEHYGTIPGCGDKPTLLKPGAEKICMTFRLSPAYEIMRDDLPKGHREYRVTCTLTHIPTGQAFGQGVGSCSTMEGKYRFRPGPVEFTGKPVPKKYWDTRDKGLLGGSGFVPKKNPGTGRWEIAIQGEKVEHDNPADYYNTVLKMAKKRAHVDAVLTATAASDIFTQDIEDTDNGNENRESKGSSERQKGDQGADGFKERAKKATGQTGPTSQGNGETPPGAKEETAKKANGDNGSALEYVESHMAEKFGGNSSKGKSWLRSQAVKAVKANGLDESMEAVGSVDEPNELPEQVLEHLAWGIKESESVPF